jgi:uncharacterized protein (DUF697 family)
MEENIKKAEDVNVTVIPEEKTIDQIISDHIIFSMVAGAIPIPVLDLVAVSAIQMDMVHKISNIYKKHFDEEIGKSLVTTLLGSAVGTTIGRAGASAMKVVPVVGTALGIGSQVILSGITTFAIGNIFNLHFKSNKSLSDFRIEDVKDTFDELLRKGKEFVEDIQKKTEKSTEDIKEQTAVVLKGMVEKGVIKEKDYNKIVTELKKK